MHRALVVVLFLQSGAAAAQIPSDLVAASRDESMPVRLDAVSRLARLDKVPPEVLRTLADLLLDQEQEVRESAAYSLARVAVRLGCDALNLGECGKIRDLVKPPVPIKEEWRVAYPEEARAKRLQGVVRVEFLVRDDGSVANPRAVSGPDVFRRAAEEGLRKRRYKPATRNGKPVPFALAWTMNFRLS